MSSDKKKPSRWDGAVEGSGGGLSTAGLLGGTAVGALRSAKLLRQKRYGEALSRTVNDGGAGWLAGSLAGAARGAAKTKKSALDGKIDFWGLPISVEHAKGSLREYKGPDGKVRASTKMKAHYGYIRGTLGTDGDHVDVYVGPDEDAKMVYVIDQMKKPDGEIVKDGKPWTKFDEQKCMLGCKSAKEATDLYKSHYTDPRFFGSVRAIPLEAFKEKVMDKENRGKKVANLFLDNPDDPRHVPPTQRKKTKIAFAANPLAAIGDGAIGAVIGELSGRAAGAVAGKYPGQSRDYGRQGGAIAGTVSSLISGPELKVSRAVKHLAKELPMAVTIGRLDPASGARIAGKALGHTATMYAPEVLGGAGSALLRARTKTKTKTAFDALAFAKEEGARMARDHWDSKDEVEKVALAGILSKGVRAVKRAIKPTGVADARLALMKGKGIRPGTKLKLPTKPTATPKPSAPAAQPAKVVKGAPAQASIRAPSLKPAGAGAEAAKAKPKGMGLGKKALGVGAAGGALYLGAKGIQGVGNLIERGTNPNPYVAARVPGIGRPY